MSINNRIINYLVRQIRDHVNIPWKHYSLRQNKAMFSQLCSSMDMIEDADNAIQAYEIGEYPDSKPFLYLATIGVLQSLVVQQDAVFHLAEALDYKVLLSDFPELIDIRNLRSESIGHPTKKDRPKSLPTSYNHIIQLSLTKQGFELLSFLGDGNPKHRYIDLHTTIAEQTKLLSGILFEIVKQLVAENREHKERFREDKLAALFHPSISYHSSKIVEAALLDNEPEFGLINLEIVIDAAHLFREAIKKRGTDLYESLAHEYELLEYVEDKLHSFFQARIDSIEPDIPALAAEVYSKFLQSQINDFKQYADDIDRDYNE